VRKILKTLAILLPLTPAAAWAGDDLVELSATNITDVLGNVRGGLKRGARVLDKADITATFLGDDHGVPGLTVFVDGQVTDGTDFSGSVVGATQAVSNIDAPAAVRLLDAWVAQDFNGKGGLKAGVVDLNADFAVQSTAALFLNDAFGVAPDFSHSGRNGPSIFPNTGLGLVGWWLPGGHWELKAGLFEGTPGNADHPGRTNFVFDRDEGALVVAEASYRLTPDFVIGAGTWHYTASFDAIDPARGRLSGNTGYYAIADGLLYAAPEGDKAGLSGWLRIGFADSRVNTIEAAITGGLVYAAPFGRMADQTGLSFTRSQFGGPARRSGSLNPAETTLEATYSFGINSHLIVQPDIQYVISPGGDPVIENAFVIGSRIIATW
jgi:porin